MGLDENQRCKGYLSLARFGWKPPTDAFNFALLAYKESEGTARGEKSARYLLNDAEAANLVDEFFMLMVSRFQFTSAATYWGDFAY